MELPSLAGHSGRTGRLELWIAILALIVLVATVGVVFYALQRLAYEVNHTNQALALRSAQAAVRSFERRLIDTQRDYALWNDAVSNLYGTPSPGFVKENLEDGTQSGILFDTAFLIDETGKDLVAYENGKALNVPSAQYFGPGLGTLIHTSSKESGSYAVTSGLMKTHDGIAAAAVGPVMPFSPEVTLPHGQKRILVFAKHLDDAQFAKLRGEFNIDGLALAAKDLPGDQGLRLFDPTGASIGTLTWTKRTPGTAALEQILPAVLGMLGLLSTIVAGIVVVCWKNLRTSFRSKLQAEHAALHDPLTELPNRTGLVAAIEGDNITGRSVNEVAIAFFDLDGFKEVNDAYGHKTGDQLLKACAAGFGYIADGKGILARVGGDEFAFVATGASARTLANTVAGQFIAFLHEPLSIEENEVRIGTSVGIAAGSFGFASVDELMRRADIAMYEAKKQGGNRVAFYDPAIDARLQDKVSLTANLRQAIASDELDVSYQMIVDAKTHEPVAAEALVRWTSPDGRPIPPEQFIPLAEESGLIDDLGYLVLRKACRDALNWEGFQLTVNVSPIQLRDPAFEKAVAQILAETGFPAARLELEFTEHHLLGEFDRAVETMKKLHNRGIFLSLDDFGTGYSSVGYLRRFQFDRLKIDRSICSGIVDDISVQHLIQGTIAIARSMNLTVIAEGVENENQARLLYLAGCDLLQGYYFGEPVEAPVIAHEILRRTKRERLAS